MNALRWINLFFAIVATAAPVAHGLELPNKLGLAGPLWLEVQQHLYRGWGPFVGGPAETGALATSLALLVFNRRSRQARNLTLVASLCYAGMIAVFFFFNAPLNAGIAKWTTVTLPADWRTWRLRWELGQAIAAVLSTVGIAVLVRSWLRER